jgi:transcriptional regulator with XRE-family HTH domain
MATIATRLADLMKEKHLTSYYLSKYTGLSESTIGRILKGQSIPNDQTLTKLAINFNVSFDWLKTGKGDQSNREALTNTYKLPSFGDRLFQYFEAKNLSVREVSELTGISPDVLENVKISGEPLSREAFTPIIQNFRDLNSDWVETGLGKMFFTKSQMENIKKFGDWWAEDRVELLEMVKETELRRLGEDRYLVITPYVDEIEYPEYIMNWEKVSLDLLPKHAIGVPSLNFSRYMSFQVIDDSLVDGSKDSIFGGSIVTGRFIDRTNWISKSLAARYKFFIIHVDSQIIFRKITAVNIENQTFLCQALNPDKVQYPDVEFEMQRVRELYTIEVVTQSRHY